ncbi:MAG: hypothetical protein MK212_06175 [Saprospiraceae bacterium]|nr:hypothetical protein [Saprospiraceae bacterium]
MTSNPHTYFSVLPLDNQRLDIQHLDSLGTDLSHTILNALLEQIPFSVGLDFSISTNESQEGQLPLLEAIEQTLLLHQKENNQLAIAYPLVLLEDTENDRFITAPLFTWDIQVLPLEGHEKKWILSATSQAKTNVQFLHYLEQTYDIHWNEMTGIGRKMDFAFIQKIAKRLAEKIPVEIIELEEDAIYQTCPEPNVLEAGQVIFSAVLAGFEKINTPNVSVQAETTEETENEKEEEMLVTPKVPIQKSIPTKTLWKTALSALPVNAGQDKFVQDLFANKDVVAEGNSKTGKTYLVAGTGISLLSDGGQILMISDKEDSFREVLEHFGQLGLKGEGVLSLYEDESIEKERLINYLEQLPEQIKQKSNVNFVNYRWLLDQYIHNRKKLDQAHSALHRTILEEEDWTSVVGCFLNYQQEESRALLYKKLDPKSFEFSDEEYQELLKSIQKSELLYKPLNTTRHPLTLLKEDLFQQLDKETNRKLYKQIETFRRRLQEFLERYLQFVNDYADELDANFNTYAQDLRQKSDTILRDIQLYEEIYGDEFDKSGTLTNARLRLLSVFSKKHQKIRVAKLKLYEDYEALQEFYAGRSYFKATLPNIRSQSTLADFDKKLNNFSEELANWQGQIPKWVDQKMNELNLDIPIRLEFRRRLENLDEAFKTLIDDLNNSQLFQKTFEYKIANVLAWESNIEDILEYMSYIYYGFNSFSQYANWKNHFLNASKSAQEIIKHLAKIAPKNWAATFRSWYLYHLLADRYTAALPEEEVAVEKYLDIVNKLRPLIAKRALQKIQNEQEECIRRIRKEKDFVLKNARAYFQNKSITEIFSWLGMKNLKSLFPFIMASPQWAKQLRQSNALFDLLFVDNAEVLNAEEYEFLGELAQQIAVLGLKRPKASITEESEPEEEVFEVANVIDEGEEVEKEILRATASLLDKQCASESFSYTLLEDLYDENDSLSTEQERSEHFAVSAFQQQVYNYLLMYLRPNRLELNATYKGVKVDILIHGLNKESASIAVLCDGWLKDQPAFDYESAAAKIRVLEDSGYITHTVWSVNWWRNTNRALQNLVAFVLRWDQQYANFG